VLWVVQPGFGFRYRCGLMLVAVKIREQGWNAVLCLAEVGDAEAGGVGGVVGDARWRVMLWAAMECD